MNVEDKSFDPDSIEGMVRIKLTKAEGDILSGDLEDSRVAEIMTQKGIEFDSGNERDGRHWVDVIVDGRKCEMVTDKNDFGTLSYPKGQAV